MVHKQLEGVLLENIAFRFAIYFWKPLKHENVFVNSYDLEFYAKTHLLSKCYGNKR